MEASKARGERGIKLVFPKVHLIKVSFQAVKLQAKENGTGFLAFFHREQRTHQALPTGVGKMEPSEELWLEGLSRARSEFGWLISAAVSGAPTEPSALANLREYPVGFSPAYVSHTSSDGATRVNSEKLPGAPSPPGVNAQHPQPGFAFSKMLGETGLPVGPCEVLPAPSLPSRERQHPRAANPRRPWPTPCIAFGRAVTSRSWASLRPNSLTA